MAIDGPLAMLPLDASLIFSRAFSPLPPLSPHPNRWNPDREDKPSYQSYKVDVNR